MNPFISYPNMRSEYPIQAIDTKNQVDHRSPKKIQLLEANRIDPDNARLFVILIRQKQIQMITDRNKIIEIEVI